MRGTLLFLISLSISSWAVGQKDTLNKFSVVPYGLRVGVNVSDLGLSLFSEDQERYSINVDFDVFKFLVQAELGFARRNRPEDSLIYRNKGSYYRVGLDYNFMFFNEESSSIFIGARYGKAFHYEDNLSYTVRDDLFGDRPVFAENTNASGEWFEANAGIKAHIWNNFFIGFIGRFKFRKRTEVGELISFDVPGFGRADETSNVSIDYYIFYRIPFRKKDLVRPPKPE